MDGERSERVQVRLDGDTPAEVVTQGRIYIVQDVLARWIESSPWWRSPTTTGIPADLGEREMWRVVASGDQGESHIFDLSFDRAHSTWSLIVDPQQGG